MVDYFSARCPRHQQQGDRRLSGVVKSMVEGTIQLSAIQDVLENRERLEVVRDLLGNLQDNDSDFDTITTVAADMFSAPAAVICLVDSDRQITFSSFGTIAHADIAARLCILALAEGDIFVPDFPPQASQDDTTAEMPPGFFIGTPIAVHGQNVGVLAVFDDAPHPETSQHQNIQLRNLANLLASLFQFKTPTVAAKHSERTTRLLLRELNHRVMNTLAVLQSLAAQTLRHAQTPEAFMAAFSGRLQALARAHTLLSDQEWGRLPVHALLKMLIAPHAMNYKKRVIIEGADISLGPDESLALVLVIHELSTNASRHGALSASDGKLVVTTSGQKNGAQNMLVIDWRESDGPATSPPEIKGFGSVLIERGLQKILGSSVTLDFQPEGLNAEIRLPVSDDDKATSYFSRH